MAQLCGPTVIQDQICVISDKVMTHYDHGPTVRPNCDYGQNESVGQNVFLGQNESLGQNVVLAQNVFSLKMCFGSK